MSAKPDEQIKKSNTILYIGADNHFYQNIKDHFKKIAPSLDVGFESIFSTDDKEIQSYILKLHRDKPKIVLIDFTKSPKALLHLVRIWMRQNSTNKIHFIGLLDQNQFEDISPKAIMAAIPCTHIKSSELDSVIFDLLLLGFPDKAEDHGFATAQMEEIVHAYYPCKVGIISENSIQIESNVPLEANQEVILDTHWSLKRVLNSSKCKLTSQEDKNLYYNFNYSQKLDFLHANPIHHDEKLSEDLLNEKNKEREQIINESISKMQKWIKLNSIDSAPKMLKAFIVDKSGSFFNHKPLTDSYPFVVRSQPFMENPNQELKSVQPQLIIFNLEKVDPEELELNKDIAHTYNDSRMLQVLVKEVETLFADTSPIIIVFNNQNYTTDYLQKTLGYQQIMAVEKDFDPDLVLTLANKLKENITKKLPPTQQGIMYINKTSQFSYAEIETDITFVGCSENDAYFNADENIPLFTTLKIQQPVPMYITVVETPKFARVQSKFYAIIHSISEVNKMELRRYINTIFFRDLELKKADEQKEVEKVREAFIEKKKKEQEEIEKKKQEEAQKDAKPDAEEKQKQTPTEDSE